MFPSVDPSFIRIKLQDSPVSSMDTGFSWHHFLYNHRTSLALHLAIIKHTFSSLKALTVLLEAFLFSTLLDPQALNVIPVCQSISCFKTFVQVVHFYGVGSRGKGNSGKTMCRQGPGTALATEAKLGLFHGQWPSIALPAVHLPP